ncbi:hypothetical protein SD81_000760 [Tolypothrix campylonemoides VB511288]|nr:hypothetical protein SD81_000760 [Tolypothrix campylonemoides VB511288]
MYSILALSLIGLNTIFQLSLPPALAQRTQSRGESSECTVALQNARSKMEKGTKVKVVEMRKFDIRQREYTDYPKNRPFGYGFKLSGSEVESTMNSIEFLKSISTDVTKNCKTVSMVTFNQDKTHWVTTYGLIDENTVRGFKCVAPDSSTKITWGYVICI